MSRLRAHADMVHLPLDKPAQLWKPSAGKWVYSGRGVWEKRITTPGLGEAMDTRFPQPHEQKGSRTAVGLDAVSRRA